MIQALIAMLVTYGAILLILQLLPIQLFLSGLFVWVMTSSWSLVAAVGGSVCGLTSRDRPVIRSVVVASVGMALVLTHSNWGALAESAQYMLLIGAKGVAVAGAVAFCVAATRRSSDQALRRISR
tara:strand:- start:1318 stop:1692 length:375 start_codon:yes stop_codon:yes gene_type:complete